MTDLTHYGVKGMKWGVRKGDSGGGKFATPSDLTRKLKNGDTLTLSGRPTGAMAKFLGTVVPAAGRRIENSSHFTIKDPKGKSVGEMSLFKESPTSLNVVWVGVDKSARGHGYATAAMKAAIDHAKSQNLKTVTLEVPGNSPDARHIYEKLGFREDKSKSEPWDPVWGGLTAMELKLDNRTNQRIKHGRDLLRDLGIG
ncbi:acetyltransferase domain protein [Streptomyces phage LibertyBell]|nr:acetyltransferase domain protein [Streptomyces phage LibertyBell]